MTSFIIVLSYFAITAGIGLYMMRKQSDVSEFFVAKRNLTAGLMVPLLFAELIAGAGTVGNAADAFKYGISSVWTNWGMCIGVFLVLIFAAKFYRVVGAKMGVMSVPEAYYRRFDQKTRIVMLVILVVVYGILFAIQPAAAASILSPMLGLNRELVAWIMAALFVILTITGGMRGLAWMNVLHSIVMYVGLGVVCFISIKTVGGFGNLAEVLSSTVQTSTFLRLDQPSLLTAIGVGFGTAISLVVASTMVAVIFGGVSMKEINRGCTIAAVLVLIFALFPAFIGACGKAAVMMGLLPANTAGASILYTMANLNGSVYGALAAMGVLAAILSTAPALLLVVTTTISRDFYKLIKPQASNQEELNFSRIVIVVLGIVCTFLGLQATSILGQVMGAFQIRSIAGVVLITAILWPRVDSRAAFWSMLVGGLIAAGWHFSGNPFGITSLWPSLAVGVPLLIVLTLMAKNPVDPKAAEYKAALDEAVKEGSL